MKSKKHRSSTKHVGEEHSNQVQSDTGDHSNATGNNIFEFKITDLFLVAFVIFLLLQGKFGIPTLRVLIDNSMEPELPFGCIALMQPTSRKDISNGDIIMLEDKSSPVRICHVARTDRNGLFCLYNETEEELLWMGYSADTTASKAVGYIPWIGLVHVLAFKNKRPLLLVASNMFFTCNILVRAVATAFLWILTSEVPAILHTVGASAIVGLWVAGDNRYGSTFYGRLRTVVVLLVVCAGSLLGSNEDLSDIAGTVLAVSLIAMETLDLAVLIRTCKAFFLVTKASLVVVKKVAVKLLDETEKASFLVADPKMSSSIEQAWNELFSNSVCIQQIAKATRKCAFCRGAASKKCGGCQSVFYCSPECQKSDWNNHKATCTPHKQSCK